VRGARTFCRARTNPDGFCLGEGDKPRNCVYEPSQPGQGRIDNETCETRPRRIIAQDAALPDGKIAAGMRWALWLVARRTKDLRRWTLFVSWRPNRPRPLKPVGNCLNSPPAIRSASWCAWSRGRAPAYRPMKASALPVRAV